MKNRMWTPPIGWHKAVRRARDARALLEQFQEEEQERRMRGLPPLPDPVSLSQSVSETINS